MENEKRCENCIYYCAGNERCVVKVWDNGQQYQMDPQKACGLWEGVSTAEKQ